ncbi:hypothetical protein BJ508DRAFT_363503 [Ascobolus immersus RN42]|uniref:Hypervirulence associated protein TUDOR domain-containing protein n=1 Tax=Ascobolus immersus RN42 TaxID=1160509 RepID=A0A3N4IBD5_ASCIM|nr:hypothetical protein BJ508DRAFT_363503 [Ascobolus immersus RN42]
MADANYNESPQGVSVKDKFGNPIKVGDTVYTPNKLGESRIMGQVEKIIVDAEDAQIEGIKNPPKVLYRDSKGRRFDHEPNALHKVVDGESENPDRV